MREFMTTPNPHDFQDVLRNTEHIKKPDLSHIDNLFDAVSSGDLKGLQSSVSMCGPQWLDAAFAFAVKHDFPNGVESAQLLIEFADKRMFEGYALMEAALHSTPQMVDFLFDKCNPKVALINLKREHPNNPDVWGYLESKIQAQHIATSIENNTPKLCGVRKI